MYISNETQKKKAEYYKKHPDSGECKFCKIPEEKIIKKIGSFFVIKNKFSYDIFDMCRVLDHLMILPTNHIDNLMTLSEKQRLEFLDLVDDYEKKGYNVFFRAPNSLVRSVDHHHTHLLKLGEEINHLEFTRKPYNLEYS